MIDYLMFIYNRAMARFWNRMVIFAASRVDYHCDIAKEIIEEIIKENNLTKNND